ncbi:MAG: HlyC/CorC family transporter [Chloroflexi bacterium]|nr:HlyC/CorC family transporter [Chloroflexota bacterium]
MELLIILLITILNGVLAMAETAFVSARKARLQQLADEGDERAKVALQMQDDPNRFLSTTQIGITLIGILAGAFGGATVAGQIAEQLNQLVPALRPYSQSIALVLIVLLTTYLSLVIGELVPKRLALQHPERITLAIMPAMRVLSVITAPVVRLLGASTNIVLRLIGARPSDEPPVTEEEIQALIRQGIEAGVFEESEHEMVAGVFSLGDRRVDAVMTPRTEMTWLDLEDALELNLRKILSSGHSRFPVGQGSLDNIQGMVRAKDLLNRALSNQPVDLKACLREPLFVPESAAASDVLEQFKKTGKHMALVISEHGGVEGLVTIYDLLEEIVGDIEAPQATEREDGSWLLDGLMPVDDLKDLFDLKVLPGEDESNYQTLGGFVMAHLGRIPATADQFEWAGLSFEVLDMDGRRVDKVLVKRLAPETPDDELNPAED